ncbi:DUF3667 domain-containing protein [Sphingomonas faeni]|uniref:DUF3667 domain-containing protein n=1 Tax=Sphingomonas faeni TaxID=185950 RepID=UPI00334CC233
MADLRRRLADAFGEDPRRTPPVPDIAVSDDWFAQPECRNCGASLTTAYCGACGQKTAKRFVWHDIRKETWDRLRLFELPAVRTLGRLIVSPGTVARDYVMGRRTAYMHPLKLLVATVALLVLMLATNQYFSVYAGVDRDGVVKRMAAQVLAYSNWSFSLGIVAIVTAAAIVFRRRLGYNLIEVIVLAIYCQSIVLAFISINLLPTLIWHDPAFILAHKAASQVYVPILKTLVVVVAYRQFFLLTWRTDWPRLFLAGIMVSAINWTLLRIYAWAILWLVSR